MNKDKRDLIFIILFCALLLAALVICVGETARAADDDPLEARQMEVHRAANALRSLGFEDDHEAITALSDEWWRCEYDTEATYIARTLYGEARGCSATEQAAVVWCILNRADNWDMDIIDVITAPGQFAGYRASNPVWSELYDLAQDVLARWRCESSGETEVGRVLPRKYMRFSGDGATNIFRDAYRGGSVWDWSWESPYD